MALQFAYNSTVKSTWDSWDKKEKILSLAGAKEGEKLWLVESWGMSGAEYDALKKSYENLEYISFEANYAPMGAMFTLIKAVKLPEWVKQHSAGLPFERPHEEGWIRGGRSVAGYNSVTSFIASFQLSQVPTCCGLCLSSATYVHATFMKKGIGTLLMELKEKIAWDARYSVIMGTLTTNMEAERKIWKKFGWKEMSSWTNRRSGNTVIVGQKELREENAGRMVENAPDRLPGKFTKVSEL